MMSSTTLRHTSNRDTSYYLRTTVNVNPHGNLLLKVLDHESQIELSTLVSSGVLKSASPVWRRMLDKSNPLSPLNGTSSPNKPKTLTLQEDNASALLVVLYAIHNIADKVPTSPTVSQLHDVAVVCDKYDCAAALHFVTRRWIPDDVTVGEGEEVEWLFIAETFGFKKMVVGIADQLKRELEVVKGDRGAVEYRTRNGDILETEGVVGRYLPAVLKSRTAHISYLLSRLVQLDTFLSSPNLEKSFTDAFRSSNLKQVNNVWYPQYFHNFEDCLDYAHGRFIRDLKKIGVYNLFTQYNNAASSWAPYFCDKEVEVDWNKSPAELQELLGNIAIAWKEELCAHPNAAGFTCPAAALDTAGFKAVPDGLPEGGDWIVSSLPDVCGKYGLKVDGQTCDVIVPWVDVGGGAAALS